MLEERAEALLPLLARAPFRDAPRGLRSLGTLEHEPFRVARGPRPRRPKLAEDALERRWEVGRHVVHEADP